MFAWYFFRFSQIQFTWSGGFFTTSGEIFRRWGLECKCVWMKLVSGGEGGCSVESFQVRCGKTSTTFSFPVLLQNLSRILTHNQNARCFILFLSWKMWFCISCGLVFFFSHGSSSRDVLVCVLVCLSVQHFGQEWNIPTTIKWITIKFGADIHGPHKLNRNRENGESRVSRIVRQRLQH